MLLYAITSRILLAQSEAERTEKLVSLAADWAAGGVNFIQIRESDLSPCDLSRLAGSVVRAVRQRSNSTEVLINASPEFATAIALDSGADGVHLHGGLNPGRLAAAIAQIRKAWSENSGQIRQSSGAPPISVSCHSLADVLEARAAGATLALFAPVFEKALPGAQALTGQGLEALAEACRAARKPAQDPPLPVLALGGIKLENAAQCVAAGAAGIAAIRLFMNEDHDPAQDWRQLSRRPGASLSKSK
ncbi:MAG TPA: thiamine phosphate synthase [Silvibacterium sp.]|nr:thiamine phosphate synthase [Silvibacterium sp.]